MKIKKIKINTKDSKYNIYIGKNIINNIPNILKKEKIYFNKCFLVIDSNIGRKILTLLKVNLKNMTILFTITSLVKKIRVLNM